MTESARTDIVDEIDALVDAQLAQTWSGYDRNVNQDRCPQPYCREPWHGLAITRRMREMRSKWHSAINYYEDDRRASEEVAAELDAYRYDEDESEVLCPGSGFVGEFTPPEDVVRAQDPANWAIEHIEALSAALGIPPIAAQLREMFGVPRVQDRPPCDGDHVHWALPELPSSNAVLALPIRGMSAAAAIEDEAWSFADIPIRFDESVPPGEVRFESPVIPRAYLDRMGERVRTLIGDNLLTDASQLAAGRAALLDEVRDYQPPASSMPADIDTLPDESTQRAQGVPESRVEQRRRFRERLDERGIDDEETA